MGKAKILALNFQTWAHPARAMSLWLALGLFVASDRRVPAIA